MLSQISHTKTPAIPSRTDILAIFQRCDRCTYRFHTYGRDCNLLLSPSKLRPDSNNLPNYRVHYKRLRVSSCASPYIPVNLTSYTCGRISSNHIVSYTILFLHWYYTKKLHSPRWDNFPAMPTFSLLHEVNTRENGLFIPTHTQL